MAFINPKDVYYEIYSSIQSSFSIPIKTSSNNKVNTSTFKVVLEKEINSIIDNQNLNSDEINKLIENAISKASKNIT